MFNSYKGWRLATLCALALGVASCSKAPPAAPSSDADIRNALAEVSTVTGASALERMEACDLKVDWTKSSFTLIPIDAESVDLKSGDRILAVDFSAPNPPGQAAGRTMARAKWLFRGEEITPRDDWATSIQQAKPPLGSAFYLNC